MKKKSILAFLFFEIIGTLAVTIFALYFVSIIVLASVGTVALNSEMDSNFEHINTIVNAFDKEKHIDLTSFLNKNISHNIPCEIRYNNDIIYSNGQMHEFYPKSMHINSFEIKTSVDAEIPVLIILFYSFLFVPIIIFLFIISYFKSQKISETINEPLSLLANKIALVNQDGLMTCDIDCVFEEIEVVKDAYFSSVDTIKDLIETNHRINIIEVESKLHSLQQNINPHFLFNTLEIISSYAELEEAYDTSELIQKLGKLFRYNLRENDCVTINKEISYIKDYFNLQNTCVNDTIKLFVDIDQSLENILIPKLTFQPIVENIFKYAFKTTCSNEIKIVSEIHNKFAYIYIIDNGIGMENEKIEKINYSIQKDFLDFRYFLNDRNHIGIRNSAYKLNTFFNQKDSIQIKSILLEETKVLIKIPLGEKNGY